MKDVEQMKRNLSEVCKNASDYELECILRAVANEFTRRLIPRTVELWSFAAMLERRRLGQQNASTPRV